MSATAEKMAKLLAALLRKHGDTTLSAEDLKDDGRSGVAIPSDDGSVSVRLVTFEEARRIRIEYRAAHQPLPIKFCDACGADITLNPSHSCKAKVRA